MASQTHSVVNLAGYFLVAHAGVKLRTDLVLFQSFDFGAFHALLAKKLQSCLHQCFADTSTLKSGQDRSIGNPADFAFVVYTGGDIADDLLFELAYEYATGVVGGHIGIDVAELAPAPVVITDGAYTRSGQSGWWNPGLGTTRDPCDVD